MHGLGVGDFEVHIFWAQTFGGDWIFGVKIGVSKNRGAPKWMVYSGNPY